MNYHDMKEEDAFDTPIKFRDPSFPLALHTLRYNQLSDTNRNYHRHNVFEFAAVLAGQVSYEFDKSHVHLNEGGCIFVNAQILHRATLSGGCSNAVVFCIQFTSGLLAGSGSGGIINKYFTPFDCEWLKGFQIRTSVKYGKELINRIHKIYEIKDTTYGYELECISHLCKLWFLTTQYAAQLYPALDSLSFNEGKKKMERMLLYIQQNFSCCIRIDDLANAAGVSKSDCFRCFQKNMNKSPTVYINEYRLIQAEKMLRDTKLSISDISAACGFSNSSYFGKIFKQRYRYSPACYRRIRKQNGISETTMRE